MARPVQMLAASCFKFNHSLLPINKTYFASPFTSPFDRKSFSTSENHRACKDFLTWVEVPEGYQGPNECEVGLERPLWAV